MSKPTIHDSPTARFLPVSEVPYGDVLVEGTRVGYSLHYFLLDLVELLAEAGVDNGLTIWLDSEIPVHWTIRHMHNRTFFRWSSGFDIGTPTGCVPVIAFLLCGFRKAPGFHRW